VIRSHRRTSIDVRTRTRLWLDAVDLELIPALFGVAIFVLTVILPTGVSVGLLTVVGLLSAFLFGVTLQVSARAVDWADSTPVPGPATSAHAAFLQGLAANSGYASPVCIISAAVFAIANVGSHWVRRISAAVGLAPALPMALTLLMGTKSVSAYCRATQPRTFGN